TYKANDGQADSNVATVSLTIVMVNQAPAGTDKTITTAEDSTYTLAVSDFGFSDSNSPANAFSSVKITALPATGSLANNGAAVTAGQFVSVADINAGKLRYTPPGNANGNGLANFKFQVKDDGGTAVGGSDLDPSANTIVFNVTPVND